MTLIRDVAPADPVVTLADVKAHLRIDHDDEDDTIAGMIEAATLRVEARLGKRLVTQSWRLVLDAFPRVIELATGPVQSVEAITYLDAAGDTRTLDPTAYRVSGLSGDGSVTIRPATSWPSTAELSASVEVSFVVGYGDPEDVPADILGAVKMLAASLYENRENAADGRLVAAVDGVDDVVAAHRRWEF